MDYSEPITALKDNPMIKEFKDSITKKAKRVVLEEFPLKITELSKALELELFTVSDLSSLHCELGLPSPSCNGPAPLPAEDQPPAKKRKFDGLAIGLKQDPPHLVSCLPCNPKIVRVIEFVKPLIIEVVDKCNILKMWIQLSIPKIEDGNNFGVSIQEDALGEVSKAESDAGSYLEQVSRYFGSRGKLLSKAAKYPHLADYQRSINEYDEKVYLSFKLILRELRNIYVVLYDVIIKNFEKIVCPRNSNTSSLY